jgi:uncharacterized membrane protein
MDNNQEQRGTEAPTSTSQPETVVTTTSAPSQAPTPNSTFDFSQNSLIAAASYLGPLVVIPFLTNKEDSFTKFHIKQGLVLFAAYLILWVLSGFMIYMFWPIIQIVNLGLFILSLIGIVNTLQHKEKELPLIGQFASKINI